MNFKLFFSGSTILDTMLEPSMFYMRFIRLPSVYICIQLYQLCFSQFQINNEDSVNSSYLSNDNTIRHSCFIFQLFFLYLCRYYICVERNRKCLARGMVSQGQFIPLSRRGRRLGQPPQRHCHLRDPQYGIRKNFKEKLREAVTKDLRALVVIYNEVSTR